ncbi:hypothetical protein XavaCFBP5823_19845 [Xanthomonas axonopodis pv. vasculorum]|nr:hypothetical protein XavaCFBP5823_19845 [Xanthomonas axonopodis pv. vasculorum]
MAAKPVQRHCLPPVRQLKIFYPTAALPTSHERKCANLSSAQSDMYAPARTDCGIHRVHWQMIERADMAGNFFTGRTPNPHERLTSEVRRSAGGRAVDARWMVAADAPHRHASGAARSSVGRPTLPSRRSRAGSRRIAAPRHASPTQGCSKKWPL